LTKVARSEVEWIDELTGIELITKKPARRCLRANPTHTSMSQTKERERIEKHLCHEIGTQRQAWITGVKYQGEENVCTLSHRIRRQRALSPWPASSEAIGVLAVRQCALVIHDNLR
jgi:hypothetical protein